MLPEIRLFPKDVVAREMPVPLKAISRLEIMTVDPAPADIPVTLLLITLLSAVSFPPASIWMPALELPESTERLTIALFPEATATPKALRLECTLSITASTTPVDGAMAMPVPALFLTTVSLTNSFPAPARTTRMPTWLKSEINT